MGRIYLTGDSTDESDDDIEPTNRFRMDQYDRHATPPRHSRSGMRLFAWFEDEEYDEIPDDSPDPAESSDEGCGPGPSASERRLAPRPQALTPTQVQLLETQFPKQRRHHGAERVKLVKAWSSRDGLEQEIENTPFTHHDPIDILRYMLDKEEVFNDSEYGAFIKPYQRHELVEKLRSLLLPRAWEVLRSKHYCRESLLSLDSEQGSEDYGVYLYNIWSKSNPNRHYLYVGQSVEMRRRIMHHRNRLYRKTHPSLHYYVWDRAFTDLQEDVEEHLQGDTDIALEPESIRQP